MKETKKPAEPTPVKMDKATIDKKLAEKSQQLLDNKLIKK